MALASGSCSDSNPAPQGGQPGTTPPSVTPSPSATPSYSPSPVPQPYPVPVPYPYPVPVPAPTPHPSPSQGLLPQGQYGGSNVNVTVSGDQVNFEFACAVGKVGHGIALDEQGDFDTQGTYQARNGPVPQGGFPTLQARYAGSFDGEHLQFTVSYDDPDQGTIATRYDAYLGNDASFDQVCALVTPSPTSAATRGPGPGPTLSPRPTLTPFGP
jgi:hypothetical protein